jgi:hypothetical protein
MQISPSEAEALKSAVVLIKYAAESPKSLPETIVVPIANAREAQETGQWSPDIAGKFWAAYSSLCDFLKPVTLETIAASATTYRRRWIFFGPKWETTLPQRTACIFMSLLIGLLVVSVLFGFINSSSTQFDSDIQALLVQGDLTAAEVSKSLTSIKNDLDGIAGPTEDSLNISLEDRRIPTPVQDKIFALRQQLQKLYYVADQLNNRTNGIHSITTFSPLKGYEKGDLSRIPILAHGFNNVRDYYATRRGVYEISQNVFLLQGFYAAIVPMLLGAIGACTHVMRTISCQIRSVTFSRASPIRHLVRVILGALAGVAIGVWGITTENSGLSAAALSFAAGYAIEPVFSTLDSIANKFKNGV